tara:strand:- start:592 stop:879 length:288 start_codon:yes stop_codon:yes gene_type:complete
MIKEMVALYLTFASPVGDVELFVRELPNCDNVREIAEEEYKKRDIDRSKLTQSGYMCIGWEHHLIRQNYHKNINTPAPVPKQPIIQPNCVVPMVE